MSRPALLDPRSTLGSAKLIFKNIFKHPLHLYSFLFICPLPLPQNSSSLVTSFSLSLCTSHCFPHCRFLLHIGSSVGLSVCLLVFYLLVCLFIISFSYSPPPPPPPVFFLKILTSFPFPSFLSLILNTSLLPFSSFLFLCSLFSPPFIIVAVVVWLLTLIFHLLVLST